MSINCLIVDDEPLSQDIVEKYLQNYPNLHLVSKCNDAFEAMEVLKSNSVDLIFLDINMPKLSGMSLAKSLLNVPEIIFITAYPQYAVEGFEVEAVDYLLKPFSVERFLIAVNKALVKIENSHNNRGAFPDDDYLIVKSNKKLHRIPHKDILYFEAIGDFVKVHSKAGVHITSETLKKIEGKLLPDQFIRIHKTYIIPLSGIEYIEGNRVKIAGTMLPIGLTFKEKLLEKFLQ